MKDLMALLPLFMVLGLLVLLAVYLRRRAAAAPPGPEGQLLYGVHGWLAFFVFASVVLSPLYGLGTTNSSILSAEQSAPHLRSNPHWQDYKTWTWVLLWVTIAWQWWVAWRLTKRFEPASPRHAIGYLIAAPLLVLAVDAFLAQRLLGVDTGAQAAEGLAKMLVPTLIWVGYFLRSKRVRNTYYPVRTLRPAVASVAPVPAPLVEAPLPATPPGPAPLQVDLRPAPAGPAADGLEERIRRLKSLFDEGLITFDDYERKKSELLRSL